MLPTDKRNQLQFLSGGGEMGALMRAKDWTSNVLGSPEDWPQSLCTTLSIILSSRFPMFLFWGPSQICFYNDAYRPSLGNNGKHPGILGMAGQQAWPEIWDIIKPLIDQVLSGGESTWNEDQLIPIFRNGHMEDVYWTFSYSPVSDESGKPAGVFVTCTESTEKVNLINYLTISQQRFQNLVRDATVGIIVLSGSEMTVEIVNDAYARLIGRTYDDLIHKPLFSIIPEAEASFRPVIDKVRNTGEPLYLYDRPYFIYTNGEKIEGFLDLVYQPYKEADGSITGVMVLCQDVSEQINARKRIETALEGARLSKEAAELGTFDLDLEKGNMEWDTRCRTLFGISHNDKVTYEKDFVTGLHPDDKDRVTEIIDMLMQKIPADGSYDVEYRTVGAEDDQLRWVRAKGKVYYDTENKPQRFIGAVLDITDQKQDELRKNDFIAMVSHELKTPLTILNVSLQLMKLAETGPGDMARGMLEKAEKQVGKMTTLINGFLNISRLESGKIGIDKQVFDLSSLLKEAEEEATATITTHEIKFAPVEITHVCADRDKIGQVINNLISNAVKYSPYDTIINVACISINGEAIVSVQDYGTGVKQEDKEKLFERYYRVNNPRSSTISGFGIGLYLCAEIIQRHDGKIWVESELGKGSTFYFSLPVTPDCDQQ